jgi:SecD/SecF fusion protein
MQQNAVMPIMDPNMEIAGFVPRALPTHVGGAAIVLNNLDPPLAVEEIRERIERQRLQPQAPGVVTTYREFDVEAPVEAGVPTRTAVVLVSDPALPYEQDPGAWQQNLAGYMWDLVGDAIYRPATLQQVNNFDAAVAGEFRRAAMIALTLSLIVMMIYIWVRFGNFKYGTATVVALAHDALFIIAAIGWAHYIARIDFLRELLLLEAFRIDLTMIAALLTVIGYSMNDTIIVFDRIRENRGKYGELSRRIINESITQTLSRTVLTSGSTLMVVLIMYIFGGPGIHGFTFALLIGIIVGTYSTILIAAPILLVGTRQGPELQERAAPAGELQQVGG